MASLSSSELLKPGREYRALVLVKKIENKEPITLNNGTKVVIKKSQQIIDILKDKNHTSQQLNKLIFLDTNNNQIKLTDIQKTAEFGGKGERSTVEKEDMALKELNDQINLIKLKNKIGYVKIQIKNKVYDVDFAQSTPGTPKSDFHLIDLNGKECIWISHKDGKSARDFQQWGGISQKKELKIFNSHETQKFISDLKSQYPNGLPNATSLYRKITDDRIKMMSIYGNEYGNSYGRQNVSIVMQGPIKLVQKQNAYVMTANHVHYNGEKIDGDFEPVFLAVYKGDRSDAGILGTRITISPIGGRRAVEF